MNINELETVLDWVRYVCSQLSQPQNEIFLGHSFEHPWDEAIELVYYTLNFSHYFERDIASARLTSEEKKQILHLLKKRIEDKIPIPYLTQRAYFAGMEFYVDERVLIPRSPIAEWIEKKFQPFIEEDQTHRILDLCTGSGCLAITAAMYFDDEVQIDAVDIDPNALAVAAINVEKHQVAHQVHLIQSDLFSAVPKQKYDVIISNPPYVNLAEYQSLPKEYIHEPRHALYADENGLAIVHNLLKQAKNYLSKHGILMIEVGNSESALIECYPDLDFIWLECERGGHGLFLLTAEQIMRNFV